MFPYFACGQQSEFRIILHYSPTHHCYETTQYAIPSEKAQLDDGIGILDDFLMFALSSQKCRPSILVNQIMEACPHFPHNSRLNYSLE